MESYSPKSFNKKIAGHRCFIENVTDVSEAVEDRKLIKKIYSEYYSLVSVCVKLFLMKLIIFFCSYKKHLGKIENM